MDEPIDDAGDPEDSSVDLPTVRSFCRRLLEDAKEYTRQRPMEGLLGAFFAGILLSLFLRRDR